MIEKAYIKRTKPDGSIELHIHEFHDGYIKITNIYPEPSDDDIYYSFDEFEEIFNIDEWLDLGNKYKIFS